MNEESFEKFTNRRKNKKTGLSRKQEKERSGETAMRASSKLMI
jgi:hypothetical protein